VGGREVAWGFVGVPPVEIGAKLESQAGKDEIEKGREGEGEAAEWDMLIRSEGVV
jgi:hypothetical protein